MTAYKYPLLLVMAFVITLLSLGSAHAQTTSLGVEALKALPALAGLASTAMEMSRDPNTINSLDARTRVNATGDIKVGVLGSLADIKLDNVDANSATIKTTVKGDNITVAPLAKLSSVTLNDLKTNDIYVESTVTGRNIELGVGASVGSVSVN